MGIPLSILDKIDKYATSIEAEVGDAFRYIREYEKLCADDHEARSANADDRAKIQKTIEGLDGELGFLKSKEIVARAGARPVQGCHAFARQEQKRALLTHQPASN